MKGWVSVKEIVSSRTTQHSKHQTSEKQSQQYYESSLQTLTRTDTRERARERDSDGSCWCWCWYWWWCHSLADWTGVADCGSVPAIFRQKICNGVDKEIYDIERNHCIVKMGRISLSLALKKAMIPLSIWFYDVINLSLLLFFFLSSLVLLLLSLRLTRPPLTRSLLSLFHSFPRFTHIILPPSVSVARVAYHFLLNFAFFLICIISHVYLSLYSFRFLHTCVCACVRVCSISSTRTNYI